ASRSTGEEMINGKKFTLTTSNTSDAGNISIQLIQGSGMTDGVKAVAEVGTNGIVVSINPQETFATIADLNTAINDAIDSYMDSNVGASHPAGTFTLNLENGVWPEGGVTGEDLCSTDYTLQDGTVDWPAGNFGGGFSPEGTTGSGFGTAFEGLDDPTLSAFTISYDADSNKFTVKATIGEKVYSGEITENKTEVGTMKLVIEGESTSSNDYIIFERPAFSTIEKSMITAANEANDDKKGGADVDDDSGKLVSCEWNPFATAGITIGADAANGEITIPVTPAAESKCLGLSSTKFVLGGGTAGGAQGIESLTGVAIGADGTIVATHPQLGEVVVGQICLVTFANPEGLVQSSGTYFTEGANSGQMNYCQPGKGGSGQLVSGSLELSNVDLSKEFSDMITTQRGYQACSRLITVSDTMLEELVNLKR
ncbi:MAG: flagellar hook-basal body complex protein, partial [Oscillospiraceae bacterium]|nr:flagellar hook-basal body complex protein [Oscillospiraceae bacterium]